MESMFEYKLTWLHSQCPFHSLYCIQIRNDFRILPYTISLYLMLKRMKHMYTLIEYCVMHPYRWHSEPSVQRIMMLSFTKKENETIEKETNPYFVTLLLMYLAECLLLSGPNFLRVASLLNVSMFSLLNSLQPRLHLHLLKLFSNCQNEQVHLTWLLQPLALMTISSPKKPLVSGFPCPSGCSFSMFPTGSSSIYL